MDTEMSAQSTPTQLHVSIGGPHKGQGLIECNGDISSVRHEIIDQVIRQNPGLNLKHADFHWTNGILMLTAAGTQVAGAPMISHKKAKEIRKEAALLTHTETRLTGHHSSHLAQRRRRRRIR